MKNKIAAVKNILAGIIIAALLLVIIGTVTPSSRLLTAEKGEDHIGLSKLVDLPARPLLADKGEDHIGLSMAVTPDGSRTDLA